jgi:hypothetical protein
MHDRTMSSSLLPGASSNVPLVHTGQDAKNGLVVVSQPMIRINVDDKSKRRQAQL